jgi:hypothetical protein
MRRADSPTYLESGSIPRVDASATLAPAGDIQVRALEQGAVLVDMRSGLCFELNRVGYEIWLLIQDGRSEASICEALAQSYQKTPESVAADVRRLVRELTQHKLVHSVPNSR